MINREIRNALNICKKSLQIMMELHEKHYKDFMQKGHNQLHAIDRILGELDKQQKEER